MSDPTKIVIEVQPPAAAQVNHVLRPRMVVSLHPSLSCSYVTVTLQDLAGNPIANALQGGFDAQGPGTFTPSGSSSSSSRRPRQYCVFRNLSISLQGTFKLFVDAQLMDEYGQQFERVASGLSNSIQVFADKEKVGSTKICKLFILLPYV